MMPARTCPAGMPRFYDKTLSDDARNVMLIPRQSSWKIFTFGSFSVRKILEEEQKLKVCIYFKAIHVEYFKLNWQRVLFT
jgi:hypothetical protein